MKKYKNFIIFVALMAAVLAALFYFNPDKLENLPTEIKDCSASSPVAEKAIMTYACENGKIKVDSQYCNATSNYMMKTITTEQSCISQPMPSDWVFVESISGDEEVNLKCPAEFSYCILGTTVSKDSAGVDYCQRYLSQYPDRECKDLGDKFLRSLYYDDRTTQMKFYSDRNYIYCVSSQCCPSYCDFKFGVGGATGVYYKGIK